MKIQDFFPSPNLVDARDMKRYRQKIIRENIRKTSKERGITNDSFLFKIEIKYVRYYTDVSFLC